MKMFDPKDTRFGVAAKLELANQLEDMGVLSSWNFVHFLNTGKLGIYDSTRYFIKTLFVKVF